MYFLFNTSWSLRDSLGDMIGICEWILPLDFLTYIFLKKKLSLSFQQMSFLPEICDKWKK